MGSGLQCPVRVQQRGLSIDPKNERLTVALGETYLMTGNIAEATKLDEQMLKNKPNDVTGRMIKGRLEAIKGDFPAALPFLREAVASYGKAASGGSSEDYRMIKLKQQAEAQTLLAMALFRTGQRKDALGILDGATQQLDKVQGNEKIEASIRESARKSLKQREQILEAIKGN